MSNHAPGPYRVENKGMDRFLVRRSGERLSIATCTTHADAKRIAYCLNIVEESEKTDRVA